jgi:hypothetical protein
MHTPGPLTTRRAHHPDDTGGFDVAILDGSGRVIGEAYERNDGEHPAEANAELWAMAPDMAKSLRDAEMLLTLHSGRAKALEETLRGIIHVRDCAALSDDPAYYWIDLAINNARVMLLPLRETANLTD